ncbi:MAG: hypothetical protein GXO41_00400, partial [Gammaproteobacteria bacterium]|nr:hypothetical protein [Gammaproteobacteria bacterium]
MSNTIPSSLSDIKQQVIEDKAKKIQAQSALDTIQSLATIDPANPATIDIKFRPSKHADFMQAAKVHTPKYKFYVEVG